MTDKMTDIDAVIKALDACIAEADSPLTSWDEELECSDTEYPEASCFEADTDAIEWLEDYIQKHPLNVSQAE